MLEIKNLSFSYGEDKLFSSVNLSLHKGLICSLIGRSGAGKSTLFKLIAGQLSVPPDCLFIEGQDMGMLVPQQRPVVTMHQEGLLFPHLNVLENVLFGTRTKFNRLRFQGEDLEAYGLQLLEEMGLVNYGGKKVTQLSGGEVQRVALARALAVKPKVLLLDEPFSALNYQQRAELAALLAALVARHKIACVKITHDNEDALMADQIMLLQDGLATQSSTVNIVDERLNLYLGRAIIVDNAPVLLSELSLDHKCGRAIVCRILSVSSGHNLFIYRLEFQGQKFKYYTREFFEGELSFYLSASPR